jgi:hypothetical protein
MTESRSRLILIWLVAAGLSGPVGIVLHELGHYLAALALGFQDLKLSFASISYRDAERFWQLLAGGDRAAAAAIYPLASAGIVAVAGPAITLALILMSAWILAVGRPSNWFAAFCAGMALMAGVRALTGVYYIVQVRPNFPGARPFFDEMNVARAFDIPVDWIVWPSLAVVVLAWLLVIPNLAPHRWTKLALAIVAPVLGILIWAQIGPFIWP